MEAKRGPTPERIQQMQWGFAPPLIVEAAVRCGVFDALDAGPRTVDEVASATGASRRGLRAVLDALVGLELLKKQGDRYALAEDAAAFLVTTKPGFLGGMFRHMSSHLLRSWMQLTEAVQTGKPARSVNREDDGGAFFREFVEDLYPVNQAAARALADALGVATATAPVTVLDLAAGSGVWGISLAEKSPQVRVTAVDWPEVLPVTQKVATRRGVADRFRFVAGDLSSADFGRGYQVATLGHILHSEGEQRSRELLQKVFAALAPGGTIVIAEIVPDEDRTGPARALIFAVNMLVHTDEGDTFTFGQMRGWLEDIGFRDARQLEVPGPSALVLATKPG
jgi:precorrin-6B methylase 2